MRTKTTWPDFPLKVECETKTYMRAVYLGGDSVVQELQTGEMVRQMRRKRNRTMIIERTSLGNGVLIPTRT